MMDLRADLDRDGFCQLAGVLDARHRAAQRDCFELVCSAASKRGGDVYGARNILQFKPVRDLFALTPVRTFIKEVLGEGALAVRGIFFDKTAGANWPVAWHQDLSLALAERHDLPGWRAWSVKAGVLHGQPPPDLLTKILTLRFHIDDCGPDNGPLRVRPGTHRLGRLAREEMSSAASRIEEHVCVVQAGDALAMRPLLLHASSAARRPTHRRVVHLEFAEKDLLPRPLRWHTQLPLASCPLQHPTRE